MDQPGTQTGARVRPGAGESTVDGLPREAYALLAQANLLRVRGRWPEAVEACLSALRLAPDSAAAQSLLGDIYENQGDLDDAAQWYRMALDVSPDSAADRLKLDRLLLRRDGLAAPPPPPDASPPPPAGLPARPAASERALRLAAALAGLAVLLVVILAFAAAHRQATLRSLGIQSDPEVRLQPVVAAPAAAPAAPVRDAAEQSLLDAVSAAPGMAALGLTASDVAVDPRTGGVSLSVVLPAGPAPGRAAILRAALAAAQACAAAGPSAPAFTVRCVLSAPGGGTLVFVGDAARAALSAETAGGGLTDDQVAALFSSPWWSPSVPA